MTLALLFAAGCASSGAGAGVHADESCPLVVGASARIPLHYEDPKISDGTPEETATYDARSKQIATEMLYVFARVKQAPADTRVSGL